MSKIENPIRGFVRCPVCSEVATVHMVGEGKLIASGEPPKNGRNVGLKYYRCPDCGNSSMSKRVDEYISQNAADEREQLTEVLTEQSTQLTVVQEPEQSQDARHKNAMVIYEPSEAVSISSAVTSSVESMPESELVVESDEVITSVSVSSKRWQRYVYALGVLVFVLFVVRAVQRKASALETEVQPSEAAIYEQ